MNNGKKASRNRRMDLYGVVFLALCVFFTMVLISYDSKDPGLSVSSNISTVHNLGGIVGAYTADILFLVFGISAYFFCAVLLLVSIMQFLGKNLSITWKESISYAILILCASTIFHLYLGSVHVSGQAIAGGGMIGTIVGEVLKRYLNTAGAYTVAITLFVLALVYCTHIEAATIFRGIKVSTVFFAEHFAQYSVIYYNRAKRHLPKMMRSIGNFFAGLFAKIQDWFKKKKTPIKINISKIEVPGPKIPKSLLNKIKPVKEIEEDEEDDEEEDEDDEEEEIAAKEVKPRPAAAATSRPSQRASAGGPKVFDRVDTKREKTADEDQMELSHMSKDYTFPALTLFDSADQKRIVVDEDILKKNAMLLEKKLKDYDVEGKITEIHPGPVITMYEFEPGIGVKVNKIVGLEDDLSVSMGGRSIRIVPHLPGKAAIGIEIPNMERETVWLKDIIGDSKFKKIPTKLPLALGKDTEGIPIVADMTKMPHLLVAGATGAGKSVAINAMICSILYKAKPDEVRMILVDPKMLELSIYEGIPHLLLPVVTKARDATLALQWGVREMERRYKLLSSVSARNILNYNTKIDKGELKLVSKEEADAGRLLNPEAIFHTERLPYIIIIIDEMADLMMVASRDIEETVTRLAQMARAAGIHLILATQRPSVDVITGLIKANFPARISFKVSSKHDSRVIIDCVGAENLLGNGDSLFMPPYASDISRIHGAFVTETEITRIVAHIKAQGKPQYNTAILEPPKAAGIEGSDEEYDELYDQALALVADTRQASISMIQRRFRIGYNRAARMIERMEADGVVGPPDGAKPREVLIQAIEREG